VSVQVAEAIFLGLVISTVTPSFFTGFGVKPDFYQTGTGDPFTDSFAVKHKWSYTTTTTNTTICMTLWSTPKQFLPLPSVSSSFLVRPQY